MTTTEPTRDHAGSGSPTAKGRKSDPHTVRRVSSYATVRPSGSPARRIAITLGLAVGAVLSATSGAIHLHLWAMGYRTIPTIGPLFLLQGLAGAALGVLLVVSRRLIIVVTAVGFMVATVGGFLISIYVGLFGFMDTLAAPYAAVSLGVESAGALVLAVVGTALVLGHLSLGSTPESAHRAGKLPIRGDTGPTRPRPSVSTAMDGLRNH